MKKDKEIIGQVKSGEQVIQEKLIRANEILRKVDMTIVYEAMKQKQP